MDDLGVYVFLSSDGKLKRDLAALNGKIPLEDLTVEQEIIEFSELLYGPYVTIVNYIAVTANYMLHDYRENNGNVDRNVFEFMMEIASHHSPDKTGQFPRYGGFRNIWFGSGRNPAVLALQPLSRLIRVRDRLRRAARLFLFQRPCLFPICPMPYL